MIRFILNDRLVETQLPPGSALLDFIRYGQHLTGTKIGCREGDCGACTVLEGRLENNQLHYRSITSCLTPLGNAHGKHIVSVEGLNMERLSPVQQAFADENASQCGFCTPGFVVSLSGYAINTKNPSRSDAIDSMNGNICRCTGYKSIERAAMSVAHLLREKDPEKPFDWLVHHGFLPAYFLDIPRRLTGLVEGSQGAGSGSLILGGGTDLLVQKPDEVAAADVSLVFDKQEMKGIREQDQHIFIGAATTANDIMHSSLMADLFPEIKKFFRLVSSDPIRNMGTLAGNLVNASPIGDLSIFFLALEASLDLMQPATGIRRRVALPNFFLEYKKLDLKPGEFVMGLQFPIPGSPFYFNFEKVSKRTHLDIASVNTAICFETEGDKIGTCRLSCGGVGPVPLYLVETSGFLREKTVSASVLLEANRILQKEIKPISDVRGSKEYKRLLARQLFFAHFLRLFPQRVNAEELFALSRSQ